MAAAAATASRSDNRHRGHWFQDKPLGLDDARHCLFRVPRDSARGGGIGRNVGVLRSAPTMPLADKVDYFLHVVIAQAVLDGQSHDGIGVTAPTSVAAGMAGWRCGQTR
jgi:hypothetical protein